MVALDSAATPLKLQQKLFRRWSKKCARFIKKHDRKRKLKRVEDELRKAVQDHQATSTVGELRAMVGQAVGLPFDGQYRLRFDRAVIRLQARRPRNAEHGAASPLRRARDLSRLRRPGRGAAVAKR